MSKMTITKLYNLYNRHKRLKCSKLCSNVYKPPLGPMITIGFRQIDKVIDIFLFGNKYTVCCSTFTNYTERKGKKWQTNKCSLLIITNIKT